MRYLPTFASQSKSKSRWTPQSHFVSYMVKMGCFWSFLLKVSKKRAVHPLYHLQPNTKNIRFEAFRYNDQSSYNLNAPSYFVLLVGFGVSKKKKNTTGSGVGSDVGTSSEFFLENNMLLKLLIRVFFSYTKK